MMLKLTKRATARRQRAATLCAACGRPGTTENPLMFVVSTNRYWHQPHCMPEHIDIAPPSSANPSEQPAQPAATQQLRGSPSTT